MLGKEEIEKANKFLKELEIEGYKYTGLGQQKYIIENVFNKIEKLESDKQQLIEKLEETIDFTKTSKDLISKAKIEVLENVLKILKGEKG